MKYTERKINKELLYFLTEKIEREWMILIGNYSVSFGEVGFVLH
jgi:hypothetical protein